MSSRIVNLPTLYAIANIDSHADPEQFIASLLSVGIKLLQIRAKKLPRDRIKEIALFALKSARASKNNPAQIIINDDINLAAEIDADGAHIGQTDHSPLSARAVLGSSKILGLSTHNVSQVSAAPVETVDYLGFGPIFISPTKQGHAATVGVGELKKAVGLSPLPIFAIGGVTLGSAAEILATGAKGMAVVSELERAAEFGSTALLETVTRYKNL